MDRYGYAIDRSLLQVSETKVTVTWSPSLRSGALQKGDCHFKYPVIRGLLY